jgi:hypothetical protein
MRADEVSRILSGLINSLNEQLSHPAADHH